MDKKTIIIQEIKYWKKHHLLPEKYCDFLLALYTEGNEQHVSKGFPFPLVVMISSSLFLLITFLVIYFTDFQIVLQITLVMFLTIIGFSVGRYLHKQHSVYHHLPIFIAAVFMLYMSVIATKALFEQPLAPLIAIALNCLVWLASGIKWKLYHFVVAGLGGLGFIIYFLGR